MVKFIFLIKSVSIYINNAYQEVLIEKKTNHEIWPASGWHSIHPLSSNIHEVTGTQVVFDESEIEGHVAARVIVLYQLVDFAKAYFCHHETIKRFR